MNRIQRALGVGLILVLAAPFHRAFADTLLIVMDSGPTFGGDELGVAAESFGAEVVADKLSKNYRKTYRFLGSADDANINSLWKQILSERQQGEQIDVFSAEHGGLDSLPDPFPSSPFPSGFIRRLYSTGCSNAGYFHSNVDGSGFKSDEEVDDAGDVWTSALKAQLKSLGVQEYIIYVNDNGTPLLALPLLLDEFSKGGSWLLGATRALDRLDDLLADSFTDLMNTDSLVSLIAPSAGSWSSNMLHARPVYGGTGLPAVRNLISDRVFYSDADEVIRGPTPLLAVQLTKYCPEVYSGDGECPNYKPQRRSITHAFNTGVNLLQRLFTVYGDKNGCIDPAPIQTVLSSVLKTKEGLSPEIQEVCFEKQSETDFRVHLILGPTPMGAALVRLGNDPEQVIGEDIWDLQFAGFLQSDKDQQGLRGLSLAREIDLRFRTQAGVTQVSTEGIGPNVDFLLHDYALKGLRFDDQGSFTAQLGFPLFTIPFALSGDYEQKALSALKFLWWKFGF